MCQIVYELLLALSVFNVDTWEISQRATRDPDKKSNQVAICYINRDETNAVLV